MDTLPNSIRRGNPRKQGLIGVGDAIAWFCSHGYDVCLPLNDSQKYDLVVDLGGDLHRIQVKTSTRQAGSGRYVVDLRTNGGNRSRRTVEHFDPATCGYVYVLTDDGQRFLIPSEQIEARATIVVGPKWQAYRV